MKMSNNNGGAKPPDGGARVDAAGGTTTDGSGSGSGLPTFYIFHNFDGPGSTNGNTVVDGMSTSGAVVGFSSTPVDANLTNFIRNPDGTFTLLGLDSTTAVANGVNRTGNVVGVTGTNAFFYTNHVETMIALASPGDTTAEIAFGINDHGAIVGQFTKGDGSSPGFLLANNTFTTISPPNAKSVNAQGVNVNGMVIGFFSTAAQLAGPVIADNPEQHGFLFDSTTSTYSALPDPSVQGLFLTQYLGINDMNRAVGYWQDMAGNQHGVIYDQPSNTLITLDSPDAKPSGGTTVTQIVGIANNGQIAGFYVDANGQSHGFYATPQ
jgi:hypothetical protein